jgi:hypothetical protein
VYNYLFRLNLQALANNSLYETLRRNNYFCLLKIQTMSLPVNNKKGNNKSGKNQQSANTGSKFIKVNSKAGGAKQKTRSTGANRGS